MRSDNGKQNTQNSPAYNGGLLRREHVILYDLENLIMGCLTSKLWHIDEDIFHDDDKLDNNKEDTESVYDNSNDRHIDNTDEDELFSMHQLLLEFRSTQYRVVCRFCHICCSKARKN